MTQQTNDEWTILEKLLLTQAVYKYGENMWFQVARVLKQHSLIQQQGIQRSSDFYNEKNCSLQYYLLVENMGSEKHELNNDMPVVVRLARQLYLQRVEEIKKRLERDQEEFNQLATEICSIKSGQWDQRLTEQSTINDKLNDNMISLANNPLSNPNNSLEDDEQQLKNWRKTIYILWQQIANSKTGTMFLNPVNNRKEPFYNKVVIKTTREFERDIVLMLTNSLMYNKEGSERYLLTLNMLEDVREQFEIYNDLFSNK
ncbi:uncharacterized protein BX663DRAFT_438330 [Cokeromyces recurvatus]|uniref:uncharacterized protein n=1 Tax=Cokeromyces recurvatus TaxID=90255 RepID=UPI00222107B0|nr:uncharacterized protein BX663DRAFT_438330 [Cokeromyces recurvatus]KAI7901071.1 hypothetical protein BX663DRAFT_438330 [Cokeromyces recurvatus]